METTSGNKNGHSANGHRLVFDNFEIDPANRTLSRDGQVVPLTGKVFDVLLVFATNPRRLLDKDELIEKVWQSDFVEEGNLAPNVSTLRKALGDTGKEHKYIVTVQGRGYKFVADVAKVSGSQANEAVEEILGVPQIDESPKPGISDSPNLSKKWFWAIPLIVVLAAIVWIGRDRIFTAPGNEIRSIAVLPLENLSGDASQDYLADGMTENIIDDLSPVSGLRVRSKNSVFRYKGKEIDIKQVAAEMGVQSLLLGKIREVNHQLVIDVELIDAADNSQIWGAQFVNSMADIVTTQKTIALSIVRRLGLPLTDTEQTRLSRGGTENPDAYRFYLLGRDVWNKRTGADLQKAVMYYDQAITIDPKYAAAYSGLANCYAIYSIYDVSSPDEAFPQAKKVAEQALALDPTLAEAHASLAFVLYHFDRDWVNAENEFKLAIKLNPNYPTAHHWYGEYLGAAGRFDEAVAEQQIALQLDPSSFIINMDLGWNYYLERRYDDAAEQYRKALKLEPNSPITHDTFSDLFAQQRRYDDSASEYFKALEASGFSDEQIGPLKLAFEKTGFTGLVQTRISWRQSVYAKKFAPQLIDIAKDYALLNKKNDALAFLQRAVQKHEADTVFLKFDPAYDNLHGDPRFDELIKQIGLP